MKERKSVFDNEGEDCWRFSDPIWSHCASMFQEAHFVANAETEYEKYHHLRACIYFAIGMVEGFLNKIRGEELSAVNKIGKEFLKEMMGSFYTKTGWPFPEKLPVEAEALQRKLLDINEVRSEVTHPKRLDQAVYRELDNISAHEVTEVATEFIVAVYEYKQKIFPYWLFGWNFIGLNASKIEVALINNGQFLHALQGMGFSIPAWDYYESIKWQKENMQTLESFRNFRDNSLYQYLPDIEPRNSMFPIAPRLTRRWWDKEFLKAA